VNLNQSIDDNFMKIFQQLWICTDLHMLGLFIEDSCKTRLCHGKKLKNIKYNAIGSIGVSQ